MIIDSHHHFWNYSKKEYGWIDHEMEVLQRDFGPETLAPLLDLTGIDGAVSVQARQSLEETDFLLDYADQHEFIRGVVGWVPLIEPDLPAVLDRYVDRARLRGVRHVLQGEPDDAYMLRDDFNAGITRLHDYGLVYDILIFQKQLRHAPALVDRHPDQVFVLDHIAKPVIAGARPPEAWSEPFRELARREQVFCKLSGMVTEVRGEDWDADLLRPYFELALECFGPDRLMFGSDWPVCLLRSGYEKWVDTVKQFIAALSETERAAIMGGTAVRAYRLEREELTPC